MKVRVPDLPPEGLDAEFPLVSSAINERLSASKAKSKRSLSPDYLFTDSVQAKIHLGLEGSMVMVKGEVEGRYTTLCARCAEETEFHAVAPVEIVLKPRTQRGGEGAGDEDLHFGFYDAQEIDCAVLVEEFLILALPYTVVCEESCRGLCSGCGKNLNREACACAQDEIIDDRFSALKGIKLRPH